MWEFTVKSCVRSAGSHWVSNSWSSYHDAFLTPVDLRVFEKIMGRPQMCLLTLRQ